MSRKFLSLTAGALLSLGLAGTAFAGGPVTLTGPQMDKVTAGWGPDILAMATASSIATSTYFDHVVALTSTSTLALQSPYGNTAGASSASLAVVK